MSSLLNKNTIISIGIDVGSINGAISVVSEEGEILLLTKAPIYQTEIKSKRNKSKLDRTTGKFVQDFRKRHWVDFKKLRSLFEPYENNPKIYTIEKIQYRPSEGETTSFMNGNSLGVFQGLYAYLQPILYLEPTPSEWKKGWKLDSNKEKSIKLAEEIYNINLKDFVAKGKVDDLAEALLLSFYGLEKYNERT